LSATPLPDGWNYVDEPHAAVEDRQWDATMRYTSAVEHAMKRKTVHFFVATAVLLVGCSKNPPNALPDSPTPTATRRLPAETDAVPTRLSLAEATSAVREDIFRSIPDMNPTAEFPLKELTTAEVWDRLHVQVFAVTSGVRDSQAYIICRRQASPLGQGFGGSGVMSICVADLDGDSRPKLFFTCSWGSGIHRSFAGLWTEGASEIHATPYLRDYDLILEKIDDSQVGVAYGEFSTTEKFKRLGNFGSLRYSAGDGKPNFSIMLDAQLPNNIRQCIWE
jgi:hypothetical protein